MKLPLTASFILLTATSWSQQDTAIHIVPVKPAAYEPHGTIATLALGLADNYRSDYSVPSGFIKYNTSGFAPIMAKLEYTLNNHFSIAGAFGYDNFIYHLAQIYEGNNGQFTRYVANDSRIFSGGINAFYHFRRLLPKNRFDPFIGLGAVLNNIRYSANPQGDSTAVKIDHTVTTYLKAGMRYYVSHRSSLYGDVGYDKHAVVSLGFSVRFLKKKSTLVYTPSAPEGNHDAGVPSLVAPYNTSQQVNVPVDTSPVIVIPPPPPLTETTYSLPDLSEYTVQFQLGKSEITKLSLVQLDKFSAIFLRDYDSMYLYIDGYADTTGTRAVNKRISLARAKSVKKYLTEKGIDPARLITVGHGSNSPIASNRTVAGRAKNRRASLRLAPDKQK